MRQLGCRVIGAGLGLPIPPRIGFTAGGVRWSLSLWLLGAYVQTADSRKIEQMSHLDRSWIYNAGVVANLLLAGVLCTAATLLAGSLWVALLLSAVTAAIWVWREQVAAYVLPALAVPALALLTYSSVNMLLDGRSPVGYAGMGALVVPQADPASMMFLFGGISVSLAVLNMLPFVPTDNARVCSRILRDWRGPKAARLFDLTGYAAMILILAAAIFSDATALVSAIF
jgi:membrane-associated protease RseP (regulator of RpoE activity)